MLPAPHLLTCQLASLFNPCLIHSPSLVQHTAADSCWGAGINRALDFGS